MKYSTDLEFEEIHKRLSEMNFIPTKLYSYIYGDDNAVDPDDCQPDGIVDYDNKSGRIVKVIATNLKDFYTIEFEDKDDLYADVIKSLSLR
ncbi:hypothetical protein HYZ41_00655 [archaeon]|nr:hypothetical protein [archaeon]